MEAAAFWKLEPSVFLSAVCVSTDFLVETPSRLSTFFMKRPSSPRDKRFHKLDKQVADRFPWL